MRGGDVHVYWVEDSTDIVDLFELALEMEGGGRVEVAPNLATALEHLPARLAGDTAPDVVLLDLQLPDGSGLTVHERLADQLASAGVRTAVLTSSVDPLDRERSERAGLQHIVKPLGFQGWCDLVVSLRDGGDG